MVVFFLFINENIPCGALQCTFGSISTNEYPQYMVFAKKKKSVYTFSVHIFLSSRVSFNPLHAGLQIFHDFVI